MRPAASRSRKLGPFHGKSRSSPAREGWCGSCVRSPAVNLQATRSSRIVTRKFFVGALQLAIAKAQRHRHCVSVVGLSSDAMSKADAAPHDLTRFATMVAGRIRATDIIFVQPPDALFLMLVDADPTAWPGIYARLVAPDFHGDVLGGGNGVPGWSWSVGGSWYPSSGSNPENLLSQATSLMTMARQDGGNRLYLPE